MYTHHRLSPTKYIPESTSATQNVPNSPTKAKKSPTPVKISQAIPKTEEELFACIFSPQNIDEINEFKYNNEVYLKKLNLIPRAKKRYIGFDDRIDKVPPFLRYSIDKFKELFTDDQHLSFFKKGNATSGLLLSSPFPMLTSPMSLFQKSTPIARFLDFSSVADETQNTQTSQQETLEQIDVTTTPSKYNRLPLSPMSPLFSIETSSSNEDDKTPNIPESFEDGKVIRFRFLMNSPQTEETLFSMGDNTDGMSHGQLAMKKESCEASCIAAGVICFEKLGGRWVVKSLSNKTGHFECDPGSLLKPIIMLLKDFTDYLQDEITLTIVPPEGSQSKEISFTLSVKKLKGIYEEMSMVLPNLPSIEPIVTTTTNEINEGSTGNNPLSFFKRKKPLPLPQPMDVCRPVEEIALPLHP